MENLFAETSISDKNKFKSFCDLAYNNDEIFDTFKKNKDFIEILEHTTYEQGLEYIQEIEKNCKIDLSILDKFKENDIYGGANVMNYKNPFSNISPSTLRYLKVLNDLIINFGDLTNYKIVEIGVGYGGQSKIIQDQFKISEYNFIDLPEVLNLTKKYLSKFNYQNLNFLDFKNLPQKKYDLVISNYAFTECSKEIQNLYLDKVINHSKKGFILGNDIGNIFNITNYSKSELLNKIQNSQILPETPLTHKDNYLLIF